MPSRSWPTRPATLATFAALLLAALSPLATAAHQDDAGTGTDAPDAWRAAILVPVGAFSGSLLEPEGDAQDWYRVLVPAGKGVRVTMTPPSGSDFDLYMLSDEGAYLRGSTNWGSAVETVVTGTPSAGVRIGVSAWHGSGAYAVTVEIVDLPDVRIVGMEVTPVPVTTDSGPLPDAAGPVSLGTQRRVAVTLQNVGLAAAEGWLATWTTQSNGDRDIGEAQISLAPGEEATFTFTWDATGQVGDAQVRASAYVPADLDRSDNEASTNGYAMVGNVGVGVDALNHYAYTPTPFVGARAGTYYAGYGAGAFGYAYAPLVYGYAGAHLSETYGPTVYACAYVVYGTCVLL